MVKIPRAYRSLVRLAVLISLLIVAQNPLGLAPLASRSLASMPGAPAPRASGLAGSPKPDWRGADLANTGVLTSTGPAIAPTQVFTAKVGAIGVTGGIELDGQGNVIFTLSTGKVYSFAPNGSMNWVFPASGLRGSYGNSAVTGPSNPVVGSDGSIYVGNDNGTLYKIDDATGVGGGIFTTTSPLFMTPKLGSDGTIYVGGADGFFYHLSSSGATLYKVAATGSIQTSGNFTGTTSGPRFKFYGEAAVDGAGNAYVGSSDTNPIGTAPLGMLY